MKQNRNMAWLTGEVAAWRDEGLVTGEQAERILARYEGSVSPRSRGLLFVLFGVLGALLIGGGVVLLVAHNWSALSRPVRTSLSLAPLVIAQALAGWVLLLRPASAAWRESVGLGWLLAVGAGIALVSQTYHMPASFDTFLLTWMLLALPVAYLLRSCSAWLAYLAGISAWALSTRFMSGAVTVYPVLVALASPLAFLWLRQARFGGPATVALWGLTLGLPFGLAGMLALHHTMSWFTAFALYFAVVYLLAEDRRRDAPTLWQNPGRVVGGIGVAVLAYLFTFGGPWEHMLEPIRNPGGSGWAIGLSYGLLATGALGVLVLLARAVLRGNHLAALWGACPFALYAGYLLLPAPDNRLPAWFMNVYLFACGLGVLIRGLRAGGLGSLNVGMLLVGGVVVTRFFDGEYPTLVRAAVFILTGAGFLAANLWMARHRRGART